MLRFRVRRYGDEAEGALCADIIIRLEVQF